MGAVTFHIWILIFQRLLLLVFLLMIGFGPGFVLGMLAANRVFGRGLPIRMEVHQENMRRASEHNAQWDPSNPKWQ
jgi:hypothetical protein